MRDKISMIIIIICTALGFSSCKHNKIIRIRFEDVGLLSNGDPIRYKGLKIGKVSQISIHDKNVLVTAKISGDIVILKCDSAIIDHIGLMGERQIRIVPCANGDPNTLDDTLAGVYPVIIPKKITTLNELVDSLESIKYHKIIKQLNDSIIGLNTKLQSCNIDSSHNRSERN